MLGLTFFACCSCKADKCNCEDSAAKSAGLSGSWIDLSGCFAPVDEPWPFCIRMTDWFCAGQRKGKLQRMGGIGGGLGAELQPR